MTTQRTTLDQGETALHVINDPYYKLWYTIPFRGKDQYGKKKEKYEKCILSTWGNNMNNEAVMYLFLDLQIR